jgi:hypothetical protein
VNDAIAEVKSSYYIEDFVISEYIDLLRLAKLNYSFIKYEEATTSSNFILWRHDCDFSLNRALRLAQIEAEHKVSATYFLNPHCDFYNILEKGQSKIIEQILSLGHQIGLHFDADYYDITSEHQLDDLVAEEAQWLRNWFGTSINTFSFHNPTPLILTCEKETYGDLINCYSSFFKKKVPYCSDSNGYWRFRRLREVLEQATDTNLHILTHPGWWQEQPMPPRNRVLRAIEGRASSLISAYDSFLESNQRINVR